MGFGFYASLMTNRLFAILLQRLLTSLTLISAFQKAELQISADTCRSNLRYRQENSASPLKMGLFFPVVMIQEIKTGNTIVKWVIRYLSDRTAYRFI